MSTTFLINIGDDEELVTVNDKRRLTAYIIERASPTRVSAEDALAAIDRGARRVDLRERLAGKVYDLTTTAGDAEARAAVEKVLFEGGK